MSNKENKTKFLIREADEINAKNEAKKLIKAAIKEGLIESIDKDVLTKLSKEVAKEALFEIENKGKDRRLHNTRLLMKNYNILKKHIDGNNEGIKIKFEHIDEENPYMKVEFMWLESIVKSKARTATILKYIDDKLDYLKNKFVENEEYEKYRAFEMFFIEEETNEKIQEELHCSKNMPKKWSDKVIKQLSILLWGIDALHAWE